MKSNTAAAAHYYICRQQESQKANKSSSFNNVCPIITLITKEPLKKSHTWKDLLQDQSSLKDRWFDFYPFFPETDKGISWSNDVMGGILCYPFLVDFFVHSPSIEVVIWYQKGKHLGYPSYNLTPQTHRFGYGIALLPIFEPRTY